MQDNEDRTYYRAMSTASRAPTEAPGRYRKIKNILQMTTTAVVGTPEQLGSCIVEPRKHDNLEIMVMPWYGIAQGCYGTTEAEVVQ